MPASDKARKTEYYRNYPFQNCVVLTDRPRQILARKCVPNTLSPPPWRRQRAELALDEIKKYQASTELLIPKEPFRKLVREQIQEQKADMRVTEGAFKTLQEAAEAYLVKLFETSQKMAIRAKRVTIKPVDLQDAIEIRGDFQKK